VTSDPPEVSIIIPIHNEVGLLETAVRALRQQWRERLDRPWELILAENGSTDRTGAVAAALANRWPGEVRVLSLPDPDYGAALKAGMLAARGELVIAEEIDLCDLDFHTRALALLDADEADLVVGSKAMPGARDARPWLRRTATRVLNGLLRATAGFRGTDTHGLKGFRRSALVPIVRDCRLGRDLFSSELVIRAERASLRVVEIPVSLAEKRPPSVALLRRVPGTIKGLVRLAVVLRDSPP
jgi:glycosyltransferase involved in cell wall biosynthesis